MPTHPSRPYPRLLNDPPRSRHTHHTTDDPISSAPAPGSFFLTAHPLRLASRIVPEAASGRTRPRRGQPSNHTRTARHGHTRASHPHRVTHRPTLPSDGAAPPVPSAPLKPTHLDDACLLRPSRRPRPPRRRQPCPAPLSCPFRRPSLPGPQPPAPHPGPHEPPWAPPRPRPPQPTLARPWAS